jgi:hypothetical protein
MLRTAAVAIFKIALLHGAASANSLNAEDIINHQLLQLRDYLILDRGCRFECIAWGQCTESGLIISIPAMPEEPACCIQEERTCDQTHGKLRVSGNVVISNLTIEYLEPEYFLEQISAITVSGEYFNCSSLSHRHSVTLSREVFFKRWLPLSKPFSSE